MTEFRVTYERPPLRVRFKRAVSGFCTHPMVQLAIVTFWVVTIACTIFVVVVNGWAT